MRGSFQDKREWLDSEIEAYLKKKEAVDQLEAQLRQREEIILEKEEVRVGSLVQWYLDSANSTEGEKVVRGRKGC